MFLKKSLISGLLLLLTLSLGSAVSADDLFTSRVVLEGLNSPWAMIWGPDGQLWITEREGSRVWSVNPTNGKKSALVEIPNVVTGPQHEGLLGLTLAPDFAQSRLVYLNYTYSDGQLERHKIVRYTYDPSSKTLISPQDILTGLPAGKDHQGGRLIFGPDGMLYFSKGELGHNQGANRCKPNEAQRLPTAAEVKAKDYSAYVGKILRLTPEGDIPNDNPVLKGVRSHVFTLGHRNPQGLLFIGERLYGVEQGPSTDDELNLLEAGGNYGWPYIAGYPDDQAYAYINWSAVRGCESVPASAYLPAGQASVKETKWNRQDFKEPLRTFFTMPSFYNFQDAKFGALAYLGWATIAPSSLDYYPPNGPIKAWRNSIIISSLKNGALYRVPLSEDRKQAQGDIIKYFHTRNRYRQVLISPDGLTIYILTDKAGNVLDENGLPSQKMANPGALLAFKYKGK
ncbi:MAG: PQQ-dependent sugar dehydrogenase [Deltaproteobacteria bacterium]|nr:PQQ-dependent sugar dehydrogenase [Deltaproteobacteria bacterium]